MVNTIEEVLNKVESVFQTAKYGLNLLVEVDEKEYPKIVPIAVRNIIVFGRSVTNVIQQLRSITPEFDEWYKKYVKEMRDDPLLRYIYKLRSELLKEGSMPVTSGVYLDEFNTDWVNSLSKPPNAVGFFIGDKFGGSGWEIDIDSLREKVYVDLPWDSIFVTVRFDDFPHIHLGEIVEENTIENVCSLYLNYLHDMIEDAKKQFLSII